MTAAEARRSRLHPKDVVSAWRNGSRSAFLSEHENEWHLLVAIAERDDEFILGLESSWHSVDDPSEANRLGFATVFQNRSGAPSTIATRQHADVDRTLSIAELVSLVAGEEHYIVPVRKRASGAFATRISVGRARNTDIVLRDPSVSKFHGWFECDAKLTSFDASKNRTRINGTPLDEKRDVSTGDMIRFGRVTAIPCNGAALCEILYAGI